MEALINKETLNKICEAKGVSIEYLSDKCKMDIQKIRKLLSLEDDYLPAFGKAKIIASKLHIPFAGLYMNSEDLPLEQIKKYKIKNFRTIIDANEDESAVNIAIYDLLQAKTALLQAQEELSLSPIAYKDIIMPKGRDVKIWASKIRKIFNINLDYQYEMSSTRKLYIYIRNRIEDKAIFVTSFTDVPVEVIRGVAIYDKEMPIIGINAKDRYPGMSFSLLHELTHILMRMSSMCNDMFSVYSNSNEEVFCNAVAGECLVPEDAISEYVRLRMKAITQEEIKKCAEYFSVSKEVITRRLLDCGIINDAQYQQHIEEIEKQFALEKEKEREEARIARSIGMRTGFPKRQELAAVDRTSTAYCKVLYEGYCNDIFSKQDLSRSLGIKQKYVGKFINEVSAWNS